MANHVSYEPSWRATEDCLFWTTCNYRTDTNAVSHRCAFFDVVSAKTKTFKHFTRREPPFTFFSCKVLNLQISQQKYLSCLCFIMWTESVSSLRRSFPHIGQENKCLLEPDSLHSHHLKWRRKAFSVVQV